MNYSMLRYTTGRLLSIEGLLLMLPVLISVIYQEDQGLIYLAVALPTFFGGLLISAKKPLSGLFFSKEGFVTVALCWIALSLVGALPLFLTGEIPSYIDSLFETISGFTTTGATIMADVEILSHASRFWRLFIHWIGGMGVLVFIIAILPSSGRSSLYLYQAESPGPTAGKLVPRMRQTAVILYSIYLAITIIAFITLLILGLTPFDSLLLACATAGTGGFGLLNSSCGDYSPVIQIAISIFMCVCATNFSFYYYFLQRKPKEAFRMEEVRVYVTIIVISTIIIAVNINPIYADGATSARHAFFQVASLISSTGFSTADFNTWPNLSKTILVVLMFVGACAGSTGGGFKVSRFVMIIKSAANEVRSIVHPHSVSTVRMNGRSVEQKVLRQTLSFLTVYISVLIVSVLLLSLDRGDFTTNFTAVLSCLGNMGPGLNLVGPSGNYGFFTVLSKFVLMFDMLAGRLELFPMLVLLSPTLWHKGR